AVEVVGDVAVMFVPIRFRHQHLDVLANDLIRGITEYSFGRRIEHQYGTATVDQDHPVNRGFEQGTYPPRAFAQRPFGRFAFGDVADDADEDRPAFLLGLADGKVHRKGRAVLAAADDFAADADDLGLAGVEVAFDVAVVLAPIGFGHQHLDVLADDLVGGIPEQLLARRIEHQHRAVRVDQDRSIDGSFKQGLHARRAFAHRPLGRFAFRDVADDADEDRPAFLLGLADGKAHRNGLSLLDALPIFAADADDLGLAGVEVA